MQAYLEGLNKPQHEAVTYLDGPSLVIAGAGSGKTRVLTMKIAYLLENGYSPSSILTLTFTNKAAREMKERISDIIGPEKARYIWMGTFHSIFARILRKEAERIGYPQSFTIYDTSDSRSLLKTIIKEKRLDEKAYKPSVVFGRISMAKNNLISPEAYAANPSLINFDSFNKVPQLYEVYAMYVNRCKKAGAMDFDDLLFNTNLLFREHPEALDKYRGIFKYILVDEYQDTNLSQYLIVKKLSEINQQICVVGDDAQSIYSFRGARLDNILKFPNDFQKCKMFKLEKNYRSTQTIVKAANSLIAKNTDQFEKNTYTDNSEGGKIKILNAYSDLEEGYQVANSIFETNITLHTPFSQFAILYRTNSQSRAMEEAMRKRNIPYKIYGGLSFYARKEIKDLLSYLRLTINNSDDEALKRIINVPARGIGKTTLDKLTAAASSNDVSLWQVCLRPEHYKVGINKGTITKVKNFSNIIESFISIYKTTTAGELTELVAKQSGILAEFSGELSVEVISKKENIEELINAAQEFSESRKELDEDDNIVHFLEDVSLITDQDTNDDDDKEKVTLMTIHASKGLEFQQVYVVGLEEDLFPSPRAIDNPKDLEEERRLFYVAITRAEQNCILSFAKSRYKYGSPTFCKPSRFFKDLDPQFLDIPRDPVLDSIFPRRASAGSGSVKGGSGKGAFKQAAKTPMQARAMEVRNRAHSGTGPQALSRSGGAFSASDPRHIKAGARVEHQRFGKGMVVALEGKDDNIKAKVEFASSGTKTLLLRFARLKLIED